MVASAAHEIRHVPDRELDRNADAVKDQDHFEVPACTDGGISKV